MTDLSRLDTAAQAAEGAILELVDPITGKPLYVDDAGKERMTITLMGADSKEYRKARHAILSQRLKATKGRRIDLSVEELDTESLKLMVKVTTGWNILLDGEKPECTRDTVFAAYDRFPWMREQVADFIEDRANFLGE